MTGRGVGGWGFSLHAATRKIATDPTNADRISLVQTVISEFPLE
jgi:hypothetical protein